MGHCVTPEQFSQLAKDLGVLAAFVVLLLVIVLFIVRSLIVDRRSANEFNKQMVQIIGDFSKTFTTLSDRFVKLDQLIDLQAQQINLLKEAIFKVDGERKDAIAQNMQAIIATQNNVKATTEALLSFRDDTVKAFENAVHQMTKARQQTVDDVNRHTDESQAKTGEAITAARNENRETHAGQTEDLQTKMDNLQKALEQNGKDTRAKVDDVLKKLESMSTTIQDMQKDLKALGIDKGLMALKLEQLVQTVDNIKRDLEPPPPPEPPKLDPLAPAPSKSGETKEDKHG